MGCDTDTATEFVGGVYNKKKPSARTASKSKVDNKKTVTRRRNKSSLKLCADVVRTASRSRRAPRIISTKKISAKKPSTKKSSTKKRPTKKSSTKKSSTKKRSLK